MSARVRFSVERDERMHSALVGGVRRQSMMKIAKEEVNKKDKRMRWVKGTHARR